MSHFNTEKELIKACLKNKRAAQRQLYEKHKVFLFGVCLRYCKTQHEAEDVLQEGFYKILKDLKQYKGGGALRAWMRKVMVNTALMHIRKHRKLTVAPLEQLNDESHAISDYSFFEKDRADAIIRLIQLLPIAQQTVFNLRAIDGYSFKEIAEQIGSNENTLRSHYARARKQLQHYLQEELSSNG